MNKIQLHKVICLEMNAMYEKKNADYGDSVGELFGRLGDISLLTRISDKYNRLMSLLDPSNPKEANFESVNDTIMDMANYCIIWLMERELRDNNAILGMDIDGDVINPGMDIDGECKLFKKTEELEEQFESFRTTMNDNIKYIEENFKNTDVNFKEIYRILGDLRGLNNWGNQKEVIEVENTEE